MPTTRKEAAGRTDWRREETGARNRDQPLRHADASYQGLQSTSTRRPRWPNGLANCIIIMHGGEPRASQRKRDERYARLTKKPGRYAR
ncbi:hypothetical protein BOTBODRAFT_239956 [Botryobasidium botryosum FD-172 SS1]|uniref:Uncharacterized protein n=1 Tax=Botryobasidium botryosum (strain FD-172 SS1) TaxID=930990 RepID=A0A067MLZ0_BOTB1|nr:hypothetical protein BOTBODRAFT_239956 [Botryobasidium botryosum FD-172 SS1]